MPSSNPGQPSASLSAASFLRVISFPSYRLPSSDLWLPATLPEIARTAATEDPLAFHAMDAPVSVFPWPFSSMTLVLLLPLQLPVLSNSCFTQATRAGHLRAGPGPPFLSTSKILNTVSMYMALKSLTPALISLLNCRPTSPTLLEHSCGCLCPTQKPPAHTLTQGPSLPLPFQPYSCTSNPGPLALPPSAPQPATPTPASLRP